MFFRSNVSFVSFMISAWLVVLDIKPGLLLFSVALLLLTILMLFVDVAVAGLFTNIPRVESEGEEG